MAVAPLKLDGLGQGVGPTGGYPRLNGRGSIEAFLKEPLTKFLNLHYPRLNGRGFIRSQVPHPFTIATAVYSDGQAAAARTLPDAPGKPR